jgi:chitinase
MFLNGTGEKRPFGNGIILDGVDFDVENGAKDADGYWVTLINELRNLTKADTSKHYFLSGAPQCVFPDE